MQNIIDGFLYDTNTATVIHIEEDTKRILYQTPNGNFFMFYPTGIIVPRTLERTRDYLGKYNVPKYIELFGKPQEA